jgi:hypothetical protein
VLYDNHSILSGGDSLTADSAFHDPQSMAYEPFNLFSAKLATQMRIEEADGALPRQLCSCLVVARRGIVVETVLHIV